MHTILMHPGHRHHVDFDSLRFNHLFVRELLELINYYYFFPFTQQFTCLSLSLFFFFTAPPTFFSLCLCWIGRFLRNQSLSCIPLIFVHSSHSSHTVLFSCSSPFFSRRRVYTLTRAFSFVSPTHLPSSISALSSSAESLI